MGKGGYATLESPDSQEDEAPVSITVQQREREQSLLIGQTHAGPLLKTLSVSLAMSLAFSVSAL